MDACLFVSPTERRTITDELSRVLGDEGWERSSLPERYGVDFLWRGHHGWYGMQRKELRDFAASLDDGRLRKEIAQMDHVIELPALVIEGKLQWTTEGIAEIARGKAVTRREWWAMQLTLYLRGVQVFVCANTRDTAELLAAAMVWSQKAKHATANSRPKAAGEWGKATSREWAAHLLQSFDGIGYDTALAIVDFFQGVPLTWAVTEAELRQVPGVGKGRAAALMNALSKAGVT